MPPAHYQISRQKLHNDNVYEDYAHRYGRTVTVETKTRKSCVHAKVVAETKQENRKMGSEMYDTDEKTPKMMYELDDTTIAQELSTAAKKLTSIAENVTSGSDTNSEPVLGLKTNSAACPPCYLHHPGLLIFLVFLFALLLLICCILACCCFARFKRKAFCRVAGKNEPGCDKDCPAQAMLPQLSPRELNFSERSSSSVRLLAD